MIILADIGNTNITIGLWNGDQLKTHWRLTSRVNQTSDELWVTLKLLLESEGYNINQIQGFALSSVVPNLTTAVTRLIENRLPVPFINVTADLDLGIKILYDNPNQVGADRLCNAVAGYERFGGPLIIVDFGTGTTFDVVSKDAEYCGGIIAPGLEVAAATLHQKAAKLPKVELQFPKSLIGKTTETSIQSGLMYGGVELVEGLNRKLIHEIGKNVRVLATGGLASALMPHLKTVNSIAPNLTLEGLGIIFNRCTKN